MTSRAANWMAAGLLVVMAGLMFRPALEDSAVVEEATHLVAGYTYWQGYKFRMLPDHPPLSQMLPAIPLFAMDVKFSPVADGFLNGQLGSWFYNTWIFRTLPVQPIVPPGCGGEIVRLPPLNDAAVHWTCPGEYPVHNWYYVAEFEPQMLGKVWLYGGDNDGDRMMLAGRLVQIGITLLTGALIFFWVKSGTQTPVAGLVALALWVFHPVALGYGHIIDTDQGLALALPLTIWLLARYFKSPNTRDAALAGVAAGVSVVMKFSGVLLAPICIALLLLHWKQLKLPVSMIAKHTTLFAVAAWVLIMIVYAPKWFPAPPMTDAGYAAFDVPSWFRTFRPVLTPPAFFKGIALVMGHAKQGHEAFLFGEFSKSGWWYFYPAVLFLKSPLAFILLMVWAAYSFIRSRKTTSPLEVAPWVAVAVYVGLAMTSKACIGVKQLLPVFPLLCVGIGWMVARLNTPRPRKIIFALLGWQAIVALLAYPQFLTFMTEAVGGAKNGHLYVGLNDYDAGQDAVRLKKYLDDRQIKHIYLDYYGNQFSIEHLKIPNTRVNPDSARQIRQGWLVVSHSQLIQPGWKWLRDSRRPIARVAHTQFVYQFP